MGKNQFILFFLTFLALIISVLLIYLWFWNPLGKKYDIDTKQGVVLCATFLSFFMNIMLRKNQAQKELKKENEITLRIYQLILLLFVIVYYLFISPANALILGLSLLITVLIIGVCMFMYAKKRNNKNTVLQ